MKINYASFRNEIRMFVNDNASDEVWPFCKEYGS